LSFCLSLLYTGYCGYFIIFELLFLFKLETVIFLKFTRLIEKESVRQLHVLPAVGKKWNCSKLVQIKYKQYIANYINFKWLEILFYNLNFYFPSHHYINHLKIL